MDNVDRRREVIRMIARMADAAGELAAAAAAAQRAGLPKMADELHRNAAELDNGIAMAQRNFDALASLHD